MVIMGESQCASDPGVAAGQRGGWPAAALVCLCLVRRIHADGRTVDHEAGWLERLVERWKTPGRSANLRQVERRAEVILARVLAGSYGGRGPRGEVNVPQRAVGWEARICLSF